MTRLFRHVLAGLVALAAFPSLAQVTTVPVRGGEHTDYTRLAITLPADVTWQVSQEGRQATLIVRNRPIQFDLSQTFARIPRSRLASLTPTENGLILSLNCDCTVRAAEDLPQMLVLDLLSPSAQTASLTAATPRPRPRPVRVSTGTVAAQAGIALAQTLRNPLTVAAPSDQPVLSAANILATVPQAMVPKPDPEGPSAADPQPTDPQVQTLTALGNALGIAVGHGLLAPVAPERFSPAVVENADSTRPIVSPSTLPQQLSVADSVTRGRTILRPTAQDATEQECPSPSALAIQDWGDATLAQHSFPDLGQIFTETDQAKPTALRQVARNLLHLGFGAEAQLVLSLLQAPTPEDALLVSLAHLIDLLPTSAASLPPQIEQCGEMEALWAALDHLPQDLPSNFPVAQAVRGVAMLPPHLRLHLGPVLLRHLAAQGQTAQAHILRDILARVASEPPLAEARMIEIPDANTASSQSLLTGSHGQRSPEDLLFALHNALQSSMPIPQTLLEEAQELVFALRGSETATELGLAVALALARNGDFFSAFALSDSREVGLDQPRRTTLRGQLFSQMTEHADDAYFLTQIFTADPWNDPVTPAIMTDIADRLQDLGFESPASDLRKRATGTPNSISDQAIENDAAAQPGPETQISLPNGTALQVATDLATQQVLSDGAADQSEGRTVASRTDRADDAAQRLSDRDQPAPQADRSTTASASASAEATALASQINEASLRQSVDPVAGNNVGLLTLGRQALADSAALRARLLPLLPDP